MKSLLITVLLAFPVSLFAESFSVQPIDLDGGEASHGKDPDVVSVKARGVGIDKNEALKDAYRDAVERVAGLYVDAEQMVKNNDVIQDQILTQSNAYIERCEIVKISNKAGVVQADIVASVRRQALTKRLVDVMPPQTVNIAQESVSLHAKVITETKRQDDVLAILNNELRELDPVRQLMKVSLGSAKADVERLPRDDSMVRLWYPFDIAVDEEKYYDIFVPRFARVFGQIAVQPSSESMLRRDDRINAAYEGNIINHPRKFNALRADQKVRSHTVNAIPSGSWEKPLAESGVALNEQFMGVNFASGSIASQDMVLSGIRSSLALRGFGSDEEDRIFGQNFHYLDINFWGMNDNVLSQKSFFKGMVLVDKKIGKGASYRCTTFAFSDECFDVVAKWQETYTGIKQRSSEHLGNKVAYIVKWMDAQNQELATAVVEFSCPVVSPVRCIVGGKVYGQRYNALWYVTPFAGAFAQSFRKWVSVDIPKDDVRRISSVKIEIQN